MDDASVLQVHSLTEHTLNCFLFAELKLEPGPCTWKGSILPLSYSVDFFFLTLFLSAILNFFFDNFIHVYNMSWSFFPPPTWLETHNWSERWDEVTKVWMLRPCWQHPTQAPETLQEKEQDECKSQRTGQELWHAVSWARRAHCTPECTAAMVTCTRPTQGQGRMES